MDQTATCTASSTASSTASAAVDPALLPTDADVAFYAEHGWWISPPVLPAALLDAAERGAERFYRGERDFADHPFDYTWKPGQERVIRKNDEVFLMMREFRDLVLCPIIGAIAARLCGQGIRVWGDQLLLKPVDTGGVRANVGWHTDRGYWTTCTSEDMLTAWIPFHDITADMGAVTYIDGSHRWGQQSTELNFFAQDLAAIEQHFAPNGQPVRKIPAVLKRGQIAFHHCLTIHGSGPNRSTRPRQSLALHLQNEDNRWRSWIGRKGTEVRVAVDELCRTDAAGHPDYTDPVAFPTLWPRQG